MNISRSPDPGLTGNQYHAPSTLTLKLHQLNEDMPTLPIQTYQVRYSGYSHPKNDSVDARNKLKLCSAMSLAIFKLDAERRRSQSTDSNIQRGRRGLAARANRIFSLSLPALQASNSDL